MSKHFTRNVLLTTIALFSLSVPASQFLTQHQIDRSQHAQFEPPTPPDPGSPSGHGQGGGAREQLSNGSWSA